MKILLPIDGSDSTRSALKQALGFAKALGASVVGLHVEPEFHMPRDEGDLMPPSKMLKQRVDAEHKARAQQILDTLAKEASGAGVKCECVVEMNDAVYEEIISTAEKRDCDLIIMASHGHRGPTATLLGSETAKVLTHTRLPVLVLR
jgi:nucleotide-binding universal stress UspA family protein